MGNNDSKNKANEQEGSKPKPTSKPNPQPGVKGSSQTPVQKAAPQFTPALPKGPPNISQSLTRAVLSLMFKSEKLLTLAKDEVDFGEPLAKAPSVPSIEALRRIAKAVIDFESSNDISETVKTIDEIAKANKQSPAEAVFHILNTGLKILRFNCDLPSVSLGDAIDTFLNSDLQDSEGTEAERVINALAVDLQTLVPLAQLKGLKGTELLRVLRTEVENNKDKLSLQVIPQTLRVATNFMYDDLGDSALEVLLTTMRQLVNSEVSKIVFDGSLLMPYSNTEQLVGFKNFQTAVNLNFGYAPFSTQLINPRVKTIKIQVHREPDVLDLYFLEAFTGVHIEGCKTFSDPNSQVVSRSNRLVEKLAICEPSVELKADYDCLTVFSKDKHFYYCLKNGPVFGQDTSQANLMTLNLHLVREPLINTLDTFKVVFVPKNTLAAKNYYYLIIFKKGDTLQKLKTYITECFSESLGTNSSSVLSKVLTGLTFSTEFSPANSVSKRVSFKAAQAFLNKGGWDTPIESLVSKFGQKDRSISEAGQNPVDLVIGLSSKSFLWTLEPNNLRREIRRQPIYLKAQLSDLWQQIYDNYFGSSTDELSEMEVRSMLPAYLFVSLDNVARMLDVPHELSFNGLEKRRKDLDLEINSKYRAIGFIAQKKNGEYYTIYVNGQNRNEVYTYLGNKKVACQMHALNPNKIKAVYYERKELDI